MNTNITEAQVVAFLRERCSEITTATGVQYVFVSCETYPVGVRGPGADHTEWRCYAGTQNGTLKSGATFDQAFQPLVAACPAFTEAQKRAAIENLLAQAANLQRSAGEIAATLPVVVPETPAINTSAIP